MVPLVRFIEIPVIDLDRAVAFYGSVFGVEIERTEIDGNEMALLPDPDGAGAGLALAKGESYRPSIDGVRIYVVVDDIAATLARAAEFGGEVLYPRTSIGNLGFVAEFRDSEGNRIALNAET